MHGSVEITLKYFRDRNSCRHLIVISSLRIHKQSLTVIRIVYEFDVTEGQNMKGGGEKGGKCERKRKKEED
jgi:hypothetical protein